MGVLTPAMRRLVDEQQLGFVASVNADGTPNLSPRGTLAVWDEDTLIFADIRSPGSTRNLRENASVVVNVVDPLTRKGYRFRGAAVVLEEGDSFEAGLEFYRRRGSGSRKRHLVLVKVERADALISPAYDDGRREQEVVAYWRAYWSALWARYPTAEPGAPGLDHAGRRETDAPRTAAGRPADWPTRLAGAGAMLGGALRLVAAWPLPALSDRGKEALYLSVDTCLLLGLAGLLAAFPPARGRLGLAGFVAAAAGILIVRTGDRLAGEEAYALGAALLAAGMACVGLVLVRRPGLTRVAGAAWLLAFGAGVLASIAAAELVATLATLLFCLGFLGAGAAMLAARLPPESSGAQVPGS